MSSVIAHKRNTLGFQSMICAHESTTVSAALSLLRKYAILSIPVYQHAEDGGKIFTGIITIFDLLGWTIFQSIFDEMESEKKYPFDSKQEFEQYLFTCDQENAYFNTCIKEIVGRSRESRGNWMMKSSDTVYSLVALLSQGGFHRALVIDEEQSLISDLSSKDYEDPSISTSGSSIVLLSQTDLLRYLWDFAGARLNTTVSHVNEMALQREAQPQKDGSRVITCLSTVNALTAFRLLYIHRVHALAIVDDQGKLCANLSASDLRGIERGNLESLMDNVLEFLEKDVKRSPGSLLSDQLRSVPPNTSANDAVRMV